MSNQNASFLQSLQDGLMFVPLTNQLLR